MTITQALKKGIENHKAGNFTEAEKYYRAILQSDPDHPDANHNLGVLAVNFGKIESAIAFFKKAIEINPNIEQFHKSLNDAQNKLQKNEAARQPAPKEIETITALFDRGKYSEALPLAQKMTEKFPDYGFGWKALGVILKMSGRSQESIEAMQKAVEFAPRDADT
ncbi:MAG: tetratricopeptide repeat protein [bacterium]